MAARFRMARQMLILNESSFSGTGGDGLFFSKSSRIRASLQALWHGQGGATAIVPHRVIGFLEQITHHISSLALTSVSSCNWKPSHNRRSKKAGFLRGFKAGTES